MWPFKNDKTIKQNPPKYKVVHMEGRGYLPCVYRDNRSEYEGMNSQGVAENTVHYITTVYPGVYSDLYHETKESAIACIDKHKNPIRPTDVYVSD